MNARLDSFSYDDDIVRKFLWATMIWGLVGMLFGLIVAIQLTMPESNFAPFCCSQTGRLGTNCILQQSGTGLYIPYMYTPR